MQNFLIDLTEIANSESVNQTDLKVHSTKKGKENIVVSARVTSESEYRYIPNNFKKQQGVAFQVTNSKINIEAGISGIHNMGNTCFFSSCKIPSIFILF